MPAIACLADMPKGKKRVVVVQGDAPPQAAMSADAPDGDILLTATLEGITPDFLTRAAPDCILAPLVTGGHDVMDIAEHLWRLQFAGLLLVITPPLPNPHLIRSEVHTAFPGLQFDLIEVKGQAKR